METLACHCKYLKDRTRILYHACVINERIVLHTPNFESGNTFPLGVGFAFLLLLIILITNYLITKSEVVTGKSQTEALPY